MVYPIFTGNCSNCSRFPVLYIYLCLSRISQHTYLPIFICGYRCPSYTYIYIRLYIWSFFVNLQDIYIWSNDQTIQVHKIQLKWNAYYRLYTYTVNSKYTSLTLYYLRVRCYIQVSCFYIQYCFAQAYKSYSG